MDICILCTDSGHPVVSRLKSWVEHMTAQGHAVSLIHDKGFLQQGDILFLVSCGQIVNRQERSKYKATLVLHASDLPKGRGWSPHIWAILGGENTITVSLLEADDPVDTGPIWFKARFTLEGHELLPEINQKLFDAELALMTQAVEQFTRISPQPQSSEKAVEQALRKRTADDSCLDPQKSLADQFELLRVVDSERYPAFFDFRGHRYRLTIEKMNHD